MANLATLDEFKIYSGMKNPENDERTEAVLSSVSSLIKTYCGRTFNDYSNDEFEEYFDGKQTYVYPREFPIIEVTTMEYSFDNGITYTEGVAGTDYIIDRRNDRIYLPTAQSYSDIGGVRLVYTGGYTSVPSDLKLAVYDMALMYLKAESVPKKTQGFTSVEYITSADFPSHIKRVLDLYRVL